MAQEPMPSTPEEVCSRAMVLCGLETMSDFSDTTRDEVIVAAQLYEVMTMANLSSYPWQFATGEQLLVVDASVPLDRYETAWTMPTVGSGIPLQLRSVNCGDLPVTYETVGDLIYAKADPTAELIAHYQFRQDEALWLPQFMLFQIFDLAATFAVAVTRNAKQIDSFRSIAEMQFGRAKTRDAQSKSPARSRMTALRRPRASLPSYVAQ